MRKIDSGDLWWKNAVFYCADIETFYDWNGDGVGDIRGMTERMSTSSTSSTGRPTTPMLVSRRDQSSRISPTLAIGSKRNAGTYIP